MTIETFKMTVYPKTIEHLGIKMYATFPIALAELIANAYDAEATRVDIKIVTTGEKSIQVIDDGVGMTPEEVNSKFLVIGRNRREEENKLTNSKNRHIMGRKGLGKLALFGLGNTVQIRTQVENETLGVSFTLDWDELRHQTEYETKATYFEKSRESHGTTVTLSNLKKRISFSAQELAEDLSQLFYGLDDSFHVYVQIDEQPIIEVTQQLRFAKLEKEFEWDLPKDIPNDIGQNYPNRSKVTGKLFTTPKPNNCRGIALYANGRMVSAPSFFNLKTSSYIYAYLTGVLQVDFIDDDLTEEIITTNRQAIDWSSSAAEGLENYLHEVIKFIETNWRQERPRKKVEKLQQFEDELKTKATEYKDKVSQRIADSICQESSQNTTKEKITSDIKNILEEENPLLGLKKQIHSIKKKILISHYGEDKKLSDLIYDLLVYNGVPEDEILYTSSNNPDSMIPEGLVILDYLRKFFVDSLSDEKMYVIYVTSEEMSHRWSPMLEVGAGWITQSKHKVFNIREFKPKKPLDTDTEWFECGFDRENNKLNFCERDMTVFIEKIKSVCSSLGYTPRTDAQLQKKLKAALKH